ncbi:MAG: glycosyltransferase family 2 protein [Elusimicrobiales bacterium]|nr:glycosyltransferase family 2 protein [Elusimicrobiales bacterium]
MSLPLIEIIIPTLNRAAMLPAAIKSALAQDYPALKVIVSDNASGDSTPAVCRAFSDDPRFVYVRQERTLPMYDHWRGVLEKNASAEWTLLLSDDDFLGDPAYISKAAALISGNPGLVLVHADFDTLYEETGELTPTRRELPALAEGSWYFINYREKASVFRLMTVLFKRSAATGFSMFSSPGIFGCDTMDFLRLSLNGKVGFVKTTAAVYRMHAGRESEGNPWQTYFENLDHIYLPYLYARDRGIFRPEELKRWLRRVFTGYFLGILEGLSNERDASGFLCLLYMTLKKYRWFAGYFFMPGLTLRVAFLLLKCLATPARKKANK